MQLSEDNPIIQEFIKKCRAHHLKITPQRIAVFRELIRSKSHPTADDMYKIVKKEYPNISFDTVNRTLLTCARIGVADIVEVFGGPKRFDPDLTDHHHMICMGCNKIIDFVHKDYDDLEIPENVSRHFEVFGKRVILKGLCRECREKKISQPNSSLLG